MKSPLFEASSTDGDGRLWSRRDGAGVGAQSPWRQARQDSHTTQHATRPSSAGVPVQFVPPAEMYFLLLLLLVKANVGGHCY